MTKEKWGENKSKLVDAHIKIGNTLATINTLATYAACEKLNPDFLPQHPPDKFDYRLMVDNFRKTIKGLLAEIYDNTLEAMDYIDSVDWYEGIEGEQID